MSIDDLELVLIDKATDNLIDVDAINSISYDVENQEIVVSYTGDLPSGLTNLLEYEGNSYKIVYLEGPKIVNHIGNIKKHKPIEHQLHHEVQGGSACGIVGSTSFGTVTMSVGEFAYELDRHKCNQVLALVSNNHVLVDSAGTQVWVNSENNVVAERTCFLPLNNNRVHVDLALARLNTADLNGGGDIRGIGVWRNIEKVSRGQDIRKFGARTGLTSGRVNKVTNIRIDGRWFRHVYETTGGFGCGGDSGSAVINSSGDWIGVYSWGEDLDCTRNPKGYFWAVHYDSQLLNELNVSISPIRD